MDVHVVIVLAEHLYHKRSLRCGRSITLRSHT